MCLSMTRLMQELPKSAQLLKNVWERQVSKQLKLKIYKVVVMTTLLCACETWKVYCRHARKLNKFHINCLCRLLRITWQDMIPDTEVLKCAGLQSIHALLEKAQLPWAGHVVRMCDERLPSACCMENCQREVYWRSAQTL